MLEGVNIDGKGYDLYSSSYINMCNGKGVPEKYDGFLKPGGQLITQVIYYNDECWGGDFMLWEWILLNMN